MTSESSQHEIEESIRQIVSQFVFQPNVESTWAAVVSAVSAYLHGLWSEGELLGATSGDAFQVRCGLGSTMTAEDILEGYMVVQVTLQLVRPAEFIELIIRQQMQGA